MAKHPTNNSKDRGFESCHRKTGKEKMGIKRAQPFGGTGSSGRNFYFKFYSKNETKINLKFNLSIVNWNFCIF